jgi:release factor glutamine methyltransferase
METRFHGVALRTEPGRVFTPRPSTEALVDTALEYVDSMPLRVADVGTGTGAVAIAVALAAPQVEVWATDTSRAAVDVARENVERYGLTDRVHVLEGNLLEPVPVPVHLVLANLPYLSEATRDAPEHAAYRDEPPEAIYAAGDGLGPYRGLLGACEAGRLLEGGHVLVQFHRRVLQADCWNLADLRARLERESEAAA